MLDYCDVAVGGATSGAVIGTLTVPAGFGNNTAAIVVEPPSAIELVISLLKCCCLRYHMLYQAQHTICVALHLAAHASKCYIYICKPAGIWCTQSAGMYCCTEVVHHHTHVTPMLLSQVLGGFYSCKVSNTIMNYRTSLLLFILTTVGSRAIYCAFSLTTRLSYVRALGVHSASQHSCCICVH